MAICIVYIIVKLRYTKHCRAVDCVNWDMQIRKLIDLVCYK